LGLTYFSTVPSSPPSSPDLTTLRLNGGAPKALKGVVSDRGVKKCGVCGDRALGYNFDAISCESCKGESRDQADQKSD
jgi:hypothetical protein